jgi:hypothetical protein
MDGENARYSANSQGLSWTGTTIANPGGGSGGGVLLAGHVITHSGVIRCNGGQGGNSPFADGSGNWQDGGGGISLKFQ